MLYEIVCDKFKTKKVLFNSGLNTVLGTNEGDNSIGKCKIRRYYKKYWGT